MNKNTLNKCILFKGLDEDGLAHALAFFGAHEKSYPRGSFLNVVSAPLGHFGLVLSGTVQVLRDDAGGHHMIMANVGAGETFGESLCLLGREAPVYICAVTDAEVLWLDTGRLNDPASLARPENAALALRFMSMLAARTLAMNDRIQLLSQLTIRAKLNTFFAQCSRQADGDSFTVPFDRSNMAFYLGTDRSALSRELCRMRDEGLIEFKSNRFRLLTKPDDAE